MELNVPDKSLFVRYFLVPLSKISENCCIVLEQDKISCLVNTADNSIILNNSFKIESSVDSPVSLNVPDIKKLIRAFEVIEEDKISLKIDKNNISYSNKNVSFKYHLLESGVINRPKINIDKINSIKFSTSFDLAEESFSEIIKASTFCVDSNKIYIFTKEGAVYGELTDRSRPNVDSFGIKITETFSGNDINNLCLNLEVLRILSTSKVKSIHTKINTELGVVLFNYNNNIINTQYIVSSLTK